MKQHQHKIKTFFSHVNYCVKRQYIHQMNTFLDKQDDIILQGKNLNEIVNRYKSKIDSV